MEINSLSGLNSLKRLLYHFKGKNLGIFFASKKNSITFASEHWTCSNSGLGCPRLKKGYRFG